MQSQNKIHDKIANIFRTNPTTDLKSLFHTMDKLGRFDLRKVHELVRMLVDEIIILIDKVELLEKADFEPLTASPDDKMIDIESRLAELEKKEQQRANLSKARAAKKK